MTHKLSVQSILKVIDNLSFEDEQELIEILNKRSTKDAYIIFYEANFYRMKEDSITASIRKFCETDIVKIEDNLLDEELINEKIRIFHSSNGFCNKLNSRIIDSYNNDINNNLYYNNFVYHVIHEIFCYIGRDRIILGEFVRNYIRNETSTEIDIHTTFNFFSNIKEYFPESTYNDKQMIVIDNKFKFIINIVDVSQYNLFDIDMYRLKSLNDICKNWVKRDISKIYDLELKDTDLVNIFKKKFRVNDNEAKNSIRYKELIELGYECLN